MSDTQVIPSTGSLQSATFRHLSLLLQRAVGGLRGQEETGTEPAVSRRISFVFVNTCPPVQRDGSNKCLVKGRESVRTVRRRLLRCSGRSIKASSLSQGSLLDGSDHDVKLGGSPRNMTNHQTVQ